jgi:SAM-dependent methyltransferase
VRPALTVRPVAWVRNHLSVAVAAAGRWIGRHRRRPHAYWERRARAHGARAVLNLAHPPAAFEAITRRQKELLLPLFRESLHGEERTVLDFGCGPGRFTDDLAQLVQGRAVGVDPVTHFFPLAPPSLRTEFVPLHDGRIPCPPDFFDAVWICLVLGGLDDATQDAAVAEIHRVLRPGGLLFLVENTSPLSDGEHWRFRSVERYRQLFSFAPLDHLGDYDDLGERISVLRGYKLPDDLP